MLIEKRTSDSEEVTIDEAKGSESSGSFVVRCAREVLKDVGGDFNGEGSERSGRERAG